VAKLLCISKKMLCAAASVGRRSIAYGNQLDRDEMHGQGGKLCSVVPFSKLKWLLEAGGEVRSKLVGQCGANCGDVQMWS
jgi:hypothetical protein